MKTFFLIAYLITSYLFQNIHASELNKNIDLADSLVWKITGAGIAEPSYLAGTFHVMCEKDFKIDERFEDALKASKQLYLELDLDDPNETSAMMNGMVAEEPLKDRLSAVHYQQTEEILTKYTAYNISQFNKTDFFAIVSMFTLASLDCPIKSLETELMSMAQAAAKPVYGLETIADQLAAATSMKPDRNDNEAWTKKELASLFLTKETLNQMIKVYQSENINELYDMGNEVMKEADNGEAILKAMLDTRNIKWAKKISGIVKQSPTFFAVGAGHLAGENGVINLLRQAGLTVTPVIQ